MKHLLISSLLLVAVSATGQSGYESAMTKALEQFKLVKSLTDMNASALLFEQIAEREKDKWLPYYYAA